MICFKLLRMFRSLNRKVECLMATQAELANELLNLGVQVQKIGTETATLKQKIADLEVAINNAPVSAEVQAAFDALKAQVQAVDDSVPDVAPPSP